MNDYRTSCLERPADAQDRCETNPPRRILVVDDDTCTRRSSVYALLLSGYKVDAVEDGADGWVALHDNRYDLLITANNIPKMSGFELLEKLQAARMAMPVILATKTLPDAALTRRSSIQPTATLLEPFTCDQLLGTVKTVLGAASMAREEMKSLPIWRRAFNRWFKAVRISIPSPEPD